MQRPWWLVIAKGFKQGLECYYEVRLERSDKRSNVIRNPVLELHPCHSKVEKGEAAEQPIVASSRVTPRIGTLRPIETTEVLSVSIIVYRGKEVMGENEDQLE